jgi:hypothetical protein
LLIIAELKMDVAQAAQPRARPGRAPGPGGGSRSEGR